jgi:hypothetical protein
LVLSRTTKTIKKTPTGRKPPPVATVTAVNKRNDHDPGNVNSTGQLLGATVEVSAQKLPSLPDSRDKEIEKLNALILQMRQDQQRNPSPAGNTINFLSNDAEDAKMPAIIKTTPGICLHPTNEGFTSGTVSNDTPTIVAGVSVPTVLAGPSANYHQAPADHTLDFLFDDTDDANMPAINKTTPGICLHPTNEGFTRGTVSFDTPTIVAGVSVPTVLAGPSANSLRASSPAADLAAVAVPANFATGPNMEQFSVPTVDRASRRPGISRMQLPRQASAFIPQENAVADLDDFTNASHFAPITVPTASTTVYVCLFLCVRLIATYYSSILILFSHFIRANIGRIVGIHDLVNEFSIGSLAAIIEAAPNIYNDEETTTMIRQMHANTGIYEKVVHATIIRFEATVKANMLLTSLMDQIPHPSTGVTLTRMYIELEGSADLVIKRNVLNACFMNFSLVLRKTDNTLYQPNTTDTTFKMIFSHLHRHGIVMNLSEFKSLKGSFYAYWKTIWAQETVVNPEFGRLPNQALVDPHDEEKIRASDYKPYEVYNDLLELLIHNVMKGWALRSSLEVSSTVYD